jgi:hypothetical protein
VRTVHETHTSAITIKSRCDRQYEARFSISGHVRLWRGSVRWQSFLPQAAGAVHDRFMIVRWVLALALLPSCSVIAGGGGSGGGGGGDDEEEDMTMTDEETPPCTEGCEIDGLDSTVGCGGVYNPDQVLDYHLTMDGGDWSKLKADATFTTYFPAQFQCGTDAPLAYNVGVRRKRSGDSVRPGIKLNFHTFQPGGNFFSLKKFSLENSVASGNAGPADRSTVIAEYMAWRTMVLSKKTISGRAAFARVFVNGELIGVYVNVEQVDKRFLRFRGKNDDGWLYKHSGGDDGYKTNETMPNPYESRLCYWSSNQCTMPSAAELATSLPTDLDIDQILHFGAVNALITNHDGPIGKTNNYYRYDDPTGAPRLYIPWDLDSVMKRTDTVFGASSVFTDALFTNWEDDYDAVLTALLAGPLTMQAIGAELDRVVSVAGAALDADTLVGGSSTAQAVTALRAWWTDRFSRVSSELAAHAP